MVEIYVDQISERLIYTLDFVFKESQIFPILEIQMCDSFVPNQIDRCH